MHEDDGRRAEARAGQPLQTFGACPLVQRREEGAVGADALIYLQHLGRQRFGQADLEVEQAGPVLVPDAQGVGHAAGDE